MWNNVNQLANCTAIVHKHRGDGGGKYDLAKRSGQIMCDNDYGSGLLHTPGYL